MCFDADLRPCEGMRIRRGDIILPQKQLTKNFGLIVCPPGERSARRQEQRAIR